MHFISRETYHFLLWQRIAVEMPSLQQLAKSGSSSPWYSFRYHYSAFQFCYTRRLAVVHEGLKLSILKWEGSTNSEATTSELKLKTQKWVALSRSCRDNHTAHYAEVNSTQKNAIYAMSRSSPAVRQSHVRLPAVHILLYSQTGRKLLSCFRSVGAQVNDSGRAQYFRSCHGCIVKGGA